MSQQEVAALRGRVAGKTYEEIAREIGVDRSRARVLALRALSRVEGVMSVRRLWDRCYLCDESSPGKGDVGVFFCNACRIRVAGNLSASEGRVGAQLNRHHETPAGHWEIIVSRSEEESAGCREG